MLLSLIAASLLCSPAAAGPGPVEIDWVSLPGGAFEMGAVTEERIAGAPHTVEVAPFELSRTEVTVAQYQACVDARVCAPPGRGLYCNGTEADRGEHPVNCVTWEEARTFAAWAGARLPTEAEWEFAARSGGQAVAFPWGGAPPTCERAQMLGEGGDGCGEDHTARVCSRPEGRSAQGVCDLSGNVWEWVEDAWHRSLEGTPTDGSARPGRGRRVVRGGSWVTPASHLGAGVRHRVRPSSRNVTLGFRLAR